MKATKRQAEIIARILFGEWVYVVSTRDASNYWRVRARDENRSIGRETVFETDAHPTLPEAYGAFVATLGEQARRERLKKDPLWTARVLSAFQVLSLSEHTKIKRPFGCTRSRAREVILENLDLVLPVKASPPKEMKKLEELVAWAKTVGEVRVPPEVEAVSS